MSISIYSWSIPESWKNGLDSKTKPRVEKKLEELKVLVKRTLRADPSKGVTIEIALKTRKVQLMQIDSLTNLLTRPTNENLINNAENAQFFNGKVRHCTQKIMDLYLKIVDLASTKLPKYMQMQVIKLLKGYETFVANPKGTVAEEEYDDQKESEFFERILSAMLRPAKFDVEFDWIKKALTVGDKEQYNITASKIMWKVNNAIDGCAIDQSMKSGFSMADYTRITTVDYAKLENSIKGAK